MKNDKRLYLREMYDYDTNRGTDDIRKLEMLVDAGGNPAVSLQFWRDVAIYGLAEAFVYLKGYRQQGLWAGDLSPVKDQVNALLSRHGRVRRFNNNGSHDHRTDYVFFNLKMAYDKWQTALTLQMPQEAGYFLARCKMFIKMIDEMNLAPPSDVVDQVKLIREKVAEAKGPDQVDFRDNPSEPTYEPDPFSRDEGPVEHAEEFTRLFSLARQWREATEWENVEVANKLEADIRGLIDMIEQKELRPPNHQADKYEKVYAFFSGRYGNNPKFGRKERTEFTHAEKPFVVSGKTVPKTGFRTLNASILFARDAAKEAKANGTDDVITVMHLTTGNMIARFKTMGPVFEQVFIKDTQTTRPSNAEPGAGLIRKKPFWENPWLIAGPNVNLVEGQAQPMIPQQAQAQPTRLVQAEHHLIPSQGDQATSRVGLEPEAEDRRAVDRRATERRNTGDRRERPKTSLRSKIARSQRRSKKTGRFYDNPGPESTSFIKVYEFSKRGQMFSGYFRFDAPRQIVTIRATETKDGLCRGFEIDILADDHDAAHMFKMLKKRGFAYVAKRLMKSKDVKAKRAYEKPAESMSVSTSGEAPPVPLPTGGVIHLPYKPTSSYKQSDEEVLKIAQSIKDQIRNEIGSGEFANAVQMLLRLRGLIKQYGNGEAMWALGWVWDDCRMMVEKRWPGAIKRFRDNKRKKRR